MKKELMIGTILAVISAIITIIIEPSRNFLIVFKERVWNIIKIFFSTIWKYLTTTHNINGFLIILSGLVWLFFIYTFLLLIKNILIGKTYEDYTEDTFHGINWRWYWKDGKIINLWCYCPICELEMSYIEDKEYYNNGFNYKYNVTFTCEHCNREYTIIEHKLNYLLGVIEREIRRKIRIGEKPEMHASSHIHT
jgi:uncharacterized protein YbaR (Trm112 family)